MPSLLKIKKHLSKLEKVIHGAKNALILIYSNPDPDGLASGWALKELLQSYDVPASIEYTGQVGRLQNASMIQALRLPASAHVQDNLKKSDLIAIVDAQPDFFKEFELPRCDIVIDHHPKKSDRKYPFSDIRPQCLATSSIMTEYFITSEKPIHKRLATALYYGIKTDSRGQRKKPSSTDREALFYLEEKADKHLLTRIEFSQYSLNDLDYFSVALIKHRYAHNVLYAHIGPVPYMDVCVQVADFLIRVKEAHWALVTGIVDDKLVIVFRCDGNLKNAGKVAQTAFGEIGSAGGHRTMGRAEIHGTSLPENISLTQNEPLEWFVVHSLSRADKAFRPLLRKLKTEGIGLKTNQDMIGKPNLG